MKVDSINQEICSMSYSISDQSEEFYVQTYDTVVPDWPGEMDFYKALTAPVWAQGQAVLEVACGTGRVAIRLAQHGGEIVGLDLSPAMLALARKKSASMANVRWIQHDMTSFNLGEAFGLALIPGHSFQFMLTAADQLACLESIRRHLVPGGTMVAHVDYPDLRWLGDLMGEKAGVHENAGQFIHPKTGRLIQTFRAWSYEPSTQTASAHTIWRETIAEGHVRSQWERGPIRLHCVFPFEMEHLLALAGLSLEAVYGDFFGARLRNDSEEMIWVAKKK
jgi:ubiquinone/menaquinone biosynthesis C-methylase UbiE